MKKSFSALWHTASAVVGALLLLTVVFAFSRHARAANYGTVLISEIMYDPAAGEPDGSDGIWEWVELYNPGSSAVSLANWKLTDEENYPTIGTDYDGICTLPLTASIPAGGFVIVAQADISANLPPTATLFICDTGSQPVTRTFEIGRDGGEVLALLDEADNIVAGSLDVPFPDLGGTNAGQAVGLRYSAYGWSRQLADWAVEDTVATSGDYRAHTAGKANTGWTWVSTPHTLTASINGTVSTSTEWSVDGEYLGKVDGVEFYLTWDTNNLYLGFSGQNALTATYAVALDRDPLDRGAANSGTTAALCGTAAFSADHKPDYALQVGVGGLTTAQATGGAWAAWTPSANTTGASNGLAAGQAEFQVAFSDLGLTYGQPLGAYLFVCDASAGAVRAAWPPENVTAASDSSMLNTGLDVALVLDAPANTQSPRYEATRQGTFTVPVGTTAASYRLWDNYMWFYPFDPPDSACDVVVRVKGNTHPVTSQGAPSRRAYEFDTGACSGMAANLNFGYEAGDAASGKVQNAPNELLSMSENHLTLSRWDGSAWQLMPSAADSQCTWSGSTWICPAGYNYDWNTGINLLTIYNISTFSIWTFSDEQDDYNPTAITLRDLRATSGGGRGGVAAGTLALLGGAWLLRRGTRPKGL